MEDFRLREAWNITWADCDSVREEIMVRGDPEEGTKNSRFQDDEAALKS
jgi:hypothetical protein